MTGSGRTEPIAKADTGGPQPSTGSAGGAVAYRRAAPTADAAPGRRSFLQMVISESLRPWTSRFGIVWVSTLIVLACFAPFIANSDPIVAKVGGEWSSPLLRGLSPIDVVLPVVFVVAVVLLIKRPLTLGQSLALLLWTAALIYAFAFWKSIPDYWRGLRGNRGELLSPTLAGILIGIAIAMLLTAIVVPALTLPRRAIAWTAGLCSPLLLVLLFFPVNPPENVVYERWRDLEKAGKSETMIRTLIPYSASDRSRDMPENRLKPPDGQHWLGTENYGADVLSRMIHATRIALAIGFIATGIAVLIGVVVGALMGYYSGRIDLFGMRIIEILEAIPRLVLLVAITATWGRNLYLMMAVIGLLSWTPDARFIRAEFLKLRKQDFVQAATAAGLPLRSILFRHMLPNGISPVLVNVSFGVASAILLESVLSFLGLGLVDEPSWGELLNQARAGGTGFNWWIALFPGMAIFLTVFAYNLVGEAVRDALDPKLMKRD